MNHPHYPELFVRSKLNPILTAASWPYPAHSVFNPGAVRLLDGSTLLLCRVEDRTGRSHLCTATSSNGIDDWSIDSMPTLLGNPEAFPEEIWGIEDPRITRIEGSDDYYIVYTAFGRDGPCVAMARTRDFITFDRMGLAMQADNKDAALLSQRIAGDLVLVHRPSTANASHMWISVSPDGKNWGGHQIMLPARKGGWWDANKVGLGPPPIKTERGWLVLYHGVRRHASGSIYRVGLALFDLEHPSVCLRRGRFWVFGPEAPYELSGDVSHVVFPTGITIADDQDTVYVYYGAADSSVCLAFASIRELLEWLDAEGTDFESDGRHG